MKRLFLILIVLFGIVGTVFAMIDREQDYIGCDNIGQYYQPKVEVQL